MNLLNDLINHCNKTLFLSLMGVRQYLKTTRIRILYVHYTYLKTTYSLIIVYYLLNVLTNSKEQNHILLI